MIARRYFEIKLYLPEHWNYQGLTARVDINAAAKHMMYCLSATGGTLFDGVGTWRSKDGETLEEPIKLIQIFSYMRPHEFMAQYAEELRVKYSQECVLYTIDGQPYFVEGAQDDED